MSAQAFLLSAYRQLLQTALASGYQFASYGDIGREEAALSCLLRHDVDAELFGTGPMADIEQALGIRATYFVMTRSTAYNLFCVEGLRAVEHLLSRGHRIGLHFMGELCEGDSSQAMAEKIRREADWLEREFGTRLEAVSFHQPTQAVLDGQVAVAGLVNTYNAAQMRDYFYVSDTNMLWKHEHPAEIFEHRLHPRLQLLLHPIWWTASPLGVTEKWRAVLEANRRVLIEHWLARERTLKGIHPRDLEG